MLRSLDLRVDVVVAEIPVLVRADDLTAARAENLLATLEATRKLGTPATVRGAIHAALASFFTSRARSRSAFTIAADFA